jgi:hypothetical protein
VWEFRLVPGGDGTRHSSWLQPSRTTYQYGSRLASVALGIEKQTAPDELMAARPEERRRTRGRKARAALCYLTYVARQPETRQLLARAGAERYRPRGEMMTIFTAASPMLSDVTSASSATVRWTMRRS